MKYTNHDVLILLTFRDVRTYNDVLNFIISVPVYVYMTLYIGKLSCCSIVAGLVHLYVSTQLLVKLCLKCTFNEYNSRFIIS